MLQADKNFKKIYAKTLEQGADQNHESRVEITNKNTQNHNYSKARQLN